MNLRIQTVTIKQLHLLIWWVWSGWGVTLMGHKEGRRADFINMINGEYPFSAWIALYVASLERVTTTT